jgi:hypothetical protein
MSCHVIFRSCTKVYSYHNDLVDEGRVHNGTKRSEVSLRSLNSLLNTMAISGCNLALTIVDDHSDDEYLSNMRNLLQKYSCDAEIINLKDTGNGPSLKQCYDIAKNTDMDLVFFVEDDYLHHPITLKEMIYSYYNFTENLGKEIGLFPCDYPDNYKRIDTMNTPSWIALGKERHWRTVTSSTCTFLCSKNVVNEYWQLFDGMGAYGIVEGINEDTTINRIWNNGNAFMLAPLPSLSVHLHLGIESPFINWQDWWNNSDWRK